MLVVLEDDVDGGEAAEKLRFAFEGKCGDVSQIRAWAKQNGYAVSERGRIAREIQDTCDAA